MLKGDYTRSAMRCPPAGICWALCFRRMALRWARHVLRRDQISYRDLDQMAQEVSIGAEGLVFLPYLVGERSPLMDPHARGTFAGLTLRHDTGHLIRAVMGGRN